MTSRWLDFPTNNPESAYTEERLAEEAQNDVYDIRTAHVMVVLNLEKSEGKAVEQGIAIMSGIMIVIVGPYSNVFQHLPRHFKRYDTLDEALSYLNDLR